MKGSNLTIGTSSAVSTSKTWVGRTLGKNKISTSTPMSTKTSYENFKAEEDTDMPSSGCNGFSNASYLISNPSGIASIGGSVSPASRAIGNIRSFTSRISPSVASSRVSLRSHRSRAPSAGQEFAFMTKSKSSTMSLPLSEALVTISDILSVSLFALVRWWKHRMQSHLLHSPTIQFDTYAFNILNEPFSLQLIPKTLQNQFHSVQQHLPHESLTVAHGLKNHGQTCFLNSVIQALASLPPVIAYLENIAMEQHFHLTSSSIVKSRHENPLDSTKGMKKEPSLTEMILGLLSSVGATSPRFHIETSSPIDTRDVLKKVGEKHAQFNGENGKDRSHLTQQDAQEFLQALMDMIVSEAEEVLGKSNTSLNTNVNTEEIALVAKSQLRQTDADNNTGPIRSQLDFDAPVSLDNLLDYIMDHQHKEHQEQLQSMEHHKQKEAEAILSRIAVSSPKSSETTSAPSTIKEEKKQDECDHEDQLERRININDDMDESRASFDTNEESHGLKQQTDGFDSQESVPISASMRMLHSLSCTTPSPLSGWVGSLLQCSSCQHVRPIQNAPFLDIPLVPTTLMKNNGRFTSSRNRATNLDPQGRPTCTLEQCLSAFSKVERVHNVECHNCARLKKMKELEEEIAILNGGIQSRLDGRKKKLQNLHGETSVSKESDNFDVDGLQSQLMECEQQYQYFASKDPDAENNDTIQEKNLMQNDLTAFSDILSQDSNVSPPPPRAIANKCLLLTRLPSILCLHVQRRFYDARLGRMLKSSSHVDFPEILDVSDQCAYGNGGSLAQNEENDKNSDCDKQVKNRIEYRLMSAVEHKGNANCGHYQTYRRVGNFKHERKWALISDENVEYVDWDVVKNCQAYMLFYEAM